MEEFKPNSYKSREENKTAARTEKKKVEKVVKGNVKTKKKSDIRKFTDIFVSEDVHNVKSYIVMDVLVPAIKKAVKDIVTDGIEMLLYGEARGSKNKGSSGYVSYDRFSRDRDRRDDRSYSSRRNGYDHDDIILESRSEAEDVLTRMDEIIEAYGEVTIADMYDLIGKSCNYTDNKYGWKNIRNAEPVRVRGGWMLKLPKAIPIDN